MSASDGDGDGERRAESGSEGGDAGAVESGDAGADGDDDVLAEPVLTAVSAVCAAGFAAVSAWGLSRAADTVERVAFGAALAGCLLAAAVLWVAPRTLVTGRGTVAVETARSGATACVLAATAIAVAVSTTDDPWRSLVLAVAGLLLAGGAVVALSAFEFVSSVDSFGVLDAEE